MQWFKKGVIGGIFHSYVMLVETLGCVSLGRVFLLSPLPVDGNVQAVEGRQGRVVLQLSQEGEVI